MMIPHIPICVFGAKLAKWKSELALPWDTYLEQSVLTLALSPFFQHA